MGPMTVDGSVVDVQSHWTADGGRIVTDATIQTPDGPVVVSQLGGHADGLGQFVFDGAPLIDVQEFLIMDQSRGRLIDG